MIVLLLLAGLMLWGYEQDWFLNYPHAWLIMGSLQLIIFTLGIYVGFFAPGFAEAPQAPLPPAQEMQAFTWPQKEPEVEGLLRSGYQLKVLDEYHFVRQNPLPERGPAYPQEVERLIHQQRRLKFALLTIRRHGDA
ncbi:MAG: hypothetical protein AAFR61_08065 [Bacteroidota bacterium]